MKRYTRLGLTFFCIFSMLTSFAEASVNIDDGIGTMNTSTLFRYDGYSKFQTEAGALTEPTEVLSLFYCIAPASWETVYTGIVSEFSSANKAGYDLSIGKYRTVAFRFGTGAEIITVQTRENIIQKDEWNTVQVDFRGDFGTVTIMVNGQIAQKMKIAIGTKIVQANVDKRIGCNYDSDIVGGGLMVRNVFDGYITEQSAQGKVSFAASRDLSDEMNHPAFHAAPIEKWMNEPHGPFFYNGKYHIFFQSNQHGPYFNNLSWGHWISEDMVKWDNLPLIIEPEFGTVSPDGCWSGSSVLAPDGTPLIFYTAGDDTKSPNQMVAVARPDNLSDPNLTNWSKDEKAIITQDQDLMIPDEFRDPFVFQENGQYWCLVGTGVKATSAGNAAVYQAKNDSLSEWEYKGFLMDYDYTPSVGHVWELPVLLPLKSTNKNITHILTVCACRVENGDPVKTYYWLGKFDAETGKFLPTDMTLRAIDENALSIGGTGFVAPDGRTVLFLIAQGKRSSDADGAAGYAHNAAFPLELWVENDEIRIRPIEEVTSLRKDVVTSLHDASAEQVNRALADVKGNEYEIVMELSNADFTLFIGKKTLSYYTGSSDFGFRGDEYLGKASVINVVGDTVTLRVIIDRSMVECFLNEQAYCATRVYTRNNRVHAVSILMDGVIKSLTIYEL